MGNLDARLLIKSPTSQLHTRKIKNGIFVMVEVSKVSLCLLSSGANALPYLVDFTSFHQSMDSDDLPEKYYTNYTLHTRLAAY